MTQIVVIQNINDAKNSRTEIIVEQINYPQHFQPENTLNHDGKIYLYYNEPFIVRESKTIPGHYTVMPPLNKE